MPNKGTVIEVARNRAIIMNERCEFLNIKAKGELKPGDEIEYSTSDIITERRYPVKILSLAASLVFCCFAAFYSFQHMIAGKAFACVGLDINPSLEIALNSKGTVIGAIGFNDDGKKLIDSSHILRIGLEDALKVILQYCITNDFLQKERPNNIGISIYAGDSGEITSRVERVLEEVLAENHIGARVFFFNIDGNTREEALKNGVSPIKYLLWTEAEEQGLFVALEDVSLNDPRINNIVSQAAQRLVVQEKENEQLTPQHGGVDGRPAEPGNGTGPDKGTEITPLNQGLPPASQMKQPPGGVQGIQGGSTGTSKSSPSPSATGSVNGSLKTSGADTLEGKGSGDSGGSAGAGAGKTDAVKPGAEGTGGINSGNGPGKSNSGRR